MNIQEFTDRTGFYPSLELYKFIEQAYMEQPADKDTFCKAYKENTDGLAEKIQRAVIEKENEREIRLTNESNKRIAERLQLMQQIENLKKQLEREQGWKPYGHNSSMKDENYARLAKSGRVMTDAEAVELIVSEFGFSADKIEIVHKIATYEINLHNRLRACGEIDRPPVCDATDWNYVRFNCAGWQYEMIDGQLYQFND